MGVEGARSTWHGREDIRLKERVELKKRPFRGNLTSTEGFYSPSRRLSVASSPARVFREFRRHALPFRRTAEVYENEGSGMKGSNGAWNKIKRSLFRDPKLDASRLDNETEDGWSDLNNGRR